MIKCTEEMLEALNKSIIHWEENLLKAEAHKLEFYDVSGSNCALCSHSNDLKCKGKGACEFCIIPQFISGAHHCIRTPYEKIQDTLITAKCEDANDWEKIIRYSAEEIVFLKNIKNQVINEKLFYITDKNGYRMLINIIDSTHLRFKFDEISDNWLSPLHFNQVSDDNIERIKYLGYVDGNFFKIPKH